MTVSEFIQANWNSFWSKFSRIQDIYMANMPKEAELYSCFLLLQIYPDSLVHTSAILSVSVFRVVQLCCKFTRVNAFTPWYRGVGAYHIWVIIYKLLFLVLIFIPIDPKKLRLNESNYKYGQLFTRFCNLLE